MTSLYSREHHALQERFGTEKLADMLDTNWVHAALSDEESAFIESRDMLFLSTVDPDGNPTVSYKGGPTGFVKVLDPSTVAFPGYDGNDGQHRRPGQGRPAVHRLRDAESPAPARRRPRGVR
jgi:predicted pyridoxine 5'-phosphate oxidase superfamily flavin-nucleotide-binding protein